MFEIQVLNSIKGFLSPQWSQIKISNNVELQLEKLTDRKDKLAAYNTLAKMMAKNNRESYRVIEVVDGVI